jgi:predicted RND superfamily exporter protein
MIERLLRFAYVRRRLVLLSVVAVLAASLLLLTRLSFDANILKLLPRNGPAVRSFDAFLEHFGTIDHIYVLFDAPAGTSIADHEVFVDRYVAELKNAPEIASVDAELFDDVKNWEYLFDRGLMLLGPDLARAALARLSPPEMARWLARSRELLAVSSPEVKAYVQQDPLGLLDMMRDRLGRGRALVDLNPTETGYVSRDGRSRLVIARPVRPPFDTEFCKQLFARLASIEATARKADAEEAAAGLQAGPTSMTVRIAGGYRIALDAERVIRHELVVNSLAALAGLLILVFAVFRTPWILLYSAVPLALAALLTLGINGLGGPLSPATSGNSAMLFGLGMDGIVLLYLRFMEERARGFGAEEAFGRASGTAKSVMLAYGTTVATFFALVFVDFPSLEDLGWLVGLGMLICCVLLLTLLPALIGVTSPARHARPVTSAWLGRFVERRGRVLLVGAAVVTVALAVSAPRLRLNMSLEKLQARTEGAALEEEVANRFGLARDVYLAIGEGPDLEPLLASADALAAAVGRELPAVSVNAPGSVLPPTAEQEAVGRVITEAGLDPATVGENLAREAAAAGFRPGTFRPFINRLPRLLDPGSRVTYEGLVDNGLSLLLSRYVARVPQGFLVAAYLYPSGPADLDRLAPLVATRAPHFHLTGVVPVNRELAARFLPQFLKGVSIGAVAVVLCVFLVFRSFRSSCLAFVSTTLGFIWSAGLLTLFGVELDLFSMFAAVTFIGIATDYDIYVIYRFSVERTRPMREVLARAGPGILVAGGTTLIGFGSLINSSYGPLRSFGIASVTMVSCSLVASLLVLPALLQELDQP